jgi:hypothetical protein
MSPTEQYSGNVKLDIHRIHIQLYVPNVLWVAFFIPPGSLSLVKYPVLSIAFDPEHLVLMSSFLIRNSSFLVQHQGNLQS